MPAHRHEVERRDTGLLLHHIDDLMPPDAGLVDLKFVLDLDDLLRPDFGLIDRSWPAAWNDHRLDSVCWVL